MSGSIYTKNEALKEFIPQLTLDDPNDEFPYEVCYKQKYYARCRQFIRFYMIVKCSDVDCLLTKLPIELVFYVADIMYHIIHNQIINNVSDGVLESDRKRYNRNTIGLQLIK